MKLLWNTWLTRDTVWQHSYHEAGHASNGEQKISIFDCLIQKKCTNIIHIRVNRTHTHLYFYVRYWTKTRVHRLNVVIPLFSSYNTVDLTSSVWAGLLCGYDLSACVSIVSVFMSRSNSQIHFDPSLRLRLGLHVVVVWRLAYLHDSIGYTGWNFHQLPQSFSYQKGQELEVGLSTVPWSFRLGELLLCRRAFSQRLWLGTLIVLLSRSEHPGIISPADNHDFYNKRKYYTASVVAQDKQARVVRSRE